MLHETLASYELALIAKNKGFNRLCAKHYRKGKAKFNYTNNQTPVDFGDILFSNSSMPDSFEADCSAPTLALLQRWTRDVKGVEVYIEHKGNHYSFIITDSEGYLLHLSCVKYDSYDLALEKGLNCALNNLI